VLLPYTATVGLQQFHSLRQAFFGNPFSGRGQRRLEARILASWALNLWLTQFPDNFFDMIIVDAAHHSSFSLAFDGTSKSTTRDA
jgi:hypothetical protein